MQDVYKKENGRFLVNVSKNPQGPIFKKFQSGSSFSIIRKMTIFLKSLQIRNQDPKMFFNAFFDIFQMFW